MDLSTLLNTTIKGYARGHIYTALPAVIKNVENLKSRQQIDVVPLIWRRYEDGLNQAPPKIFNVPVVFPAGGNAAMTFPLKEGDTVLLIFSMRSIEGWKNADLEGESVPRSSRSHHISDAFAIPGAYTSPSSFEPNEDNMEIKFFYKGRPWIDPRLRGSLTEDDYYEPSRAVFSVDGSIHLEVPESEISVSLNHIPQPAGDDPPIPEGEGASVSVNNGEHSLTLKSDGSVVHSSGAMITAEGDFVTATGVSLNNHFHTQLPDTDGDAEQPTDPPTPTEIEEP